MLTTFICIGTNARLNRRPLTLNKAAGRVQSWLDQPAVHLLQRTDRRWTIFQQMLRAANATANLVSDAHHAALAVEHNCAPQSADTDFAHFKDLKMEEFLGVN